MATTKIILPEKGKQNILISSALPYVNNVPHLGNIIGSVLSADVFSRYSKLRQRPTLFICGTDEYGTATETKALEEKTTPQELCDKYHKLHKEVYDWFEIGFDYFGRTTTEEQTKIAQDIFLKLHKNGYLEERTTKQPYCEVEEHQSFLADRFVEGTCPKCGYDDARGDQCDKCGELLDPFELINPHCKLHKDATPVARDTTHIFLLLDKAQPAIEEWFAKSHEEGKWPQNGISITSSWLKQGLEGRSITRDLKWGTPIPLEGYEKKVLYVWFDACIGYPSITANYTKDWEQWWRNPEEVKLYQFMGKDNVPFHTIIFPGSQIGTGDKWTMLNHLSTTEYLNYEDGKFSKSRGVGVFGDGAKETGIPPSVWRYYLLANRPETGDTQFEWSSFIAANNSELLANLGNFVNRVVKFVNAKLDSTVPEFSATYEDDTFDFQAWIKEVNTHLAEYVVGMDAVKIRESLKKIMAISSCGNDLLQYRMDNANLVNSPARTHATVGFALNLAYLLASICSPYMPSTADLIVKQLSVPLGPIPDQWSPDTLKSGHKIGKAAYLFTKIPPEKEQEWKERFGGTQAARAEEEAAKAKKAADKARDKERKRLKKEAAKLEAAQYGNKTETSTEATPAAAEEKIKDAETELPLRGKLTEEKAPPPAAAP
ncbi:methionyl-tRNA synthetase [Acephala macrosclerotiorum]|nr:methionyl-tRNA synthetase [Acephala macrosclerotiorum]